MLGIGAIGQYALAQFPALFAGQDSPAWRRLLAYVKPEATLNREAPAWATNPDPLDGTPLGAIRPVDDEEEAVELLLSSF